MLLEHTLYFKTLQEARDAENALMQMNIDYSNVQVSDRAGGPLLSFQTTSELNLAVQVLLESAAQSVSADFNVDSAELLAWEKVFGAIPVAPGAQALAFQHKDLWEQVRQAGGWMTEEQESELNCLFSGIYPHLGGNVSNGKPVWENIVDRIDLDKNQTVVLLIFEDDTAAVQLRYVGDALIPLDFDQSVRLACALLAHTGSRGNEVEDLRCSRLERLSTKTRTRVAFRNGCCVSCGIRRRGSYGLWCMACKRASLKSSEPEADLCPLCDMQSEHAHKALLFLACLGLAVCSLVAVFAGVVLPGLLPGMLTGLLLWWSEGREKRADRSSHL